MKFSLVNASRHRNRECRNRASGIINIRFAVILSLFMIVILFVSTSFGQYYNPNDERYKFLALKKAEVKLQEIRGRYEMHKVLFEKGLISDETFHNVEREYRLTEIEFQQALLAVVFEKPYVMIKEAVKYLGEDGSKMVSLTLVNSTGGLPDMSKLKNLDESAGLTELVDYVAYDRLTNVYVSLRSETSIISQPYEHKIEVMEYNKPVKAVFTLLRDLDEVTVSISYGGQIQEKKITLTKDSKLDPIIINSIQFSQTANLGGRAIYDLALEQYTGGTDVYQMMVVNLPKQIAHEFRSTDGQTKISQVRFHEGTTTQNLVLALYLPERADDDIKINSPIAFYAIAASPEGASELKVQNGESISPETINRISGGKVQLELIPRGKGKIALHLPQLFYSISKGQYLEFNADIKNEGTVTLYNITVGFDLPYDWTVKLKPEYIDELSVDDETRVIVTCRPPTNIAVGDYEITMRAEVAVDNIIVEAPPKTVRVEISSDGGLWVSILVVALLVAIMAGGILFFIKMAHR